MLLMKQLLHLSKMKPVHVRITSPNFHISRTFNNEFILLKLLRSVKFRYKEMIKVEIRPCIYGR